MRRCGPWAVSGLIKQSFCLPKGTGAGVKCPCGGSHRTPLLGKSASVPNYRFDRRARPWQTTVPSQPHSNGGSSTLAKADLGIKRTCPSCGVRFYDLQKRPIECPKCAFTFEPEALYKQRRQRQPEPQAVEPEADREEEDAEEAEEEEVEAEAAEPVKAKAKKKLSSDEDEEADDEDDGEETEEDFEEAGMSVVDADEDEADDLADLDDDDVEDSDDEEDLLVDEDDEDDVSGIIDADIEKDEP